VANVLCYKSEGCWFNQKISQVSQPNGKSDAKQDGVQHTKARLGEYLKKKWKNKVTHGQFIRNIDRQLFSEEDTFLWLSKGDIKQKMKVK